MKLPRPAKAVAARAAERVWGRQASLRELHARAAGVTHGLRTVGLRFFNLYGPRQDPRSPYSGVIAIFMDRLRRGEPIDIYGDGGQVRDFVYITDAVAALRLAMPRASEQAPVYNVCTGQGTKVGQLAETIATLCGTELVVTPRPARRGEVQCSIGDPRRSCRGTGGFARAHCPARGFGGNA